MKILFTIIVLPITIIISIICFLFVLAFESDFKTKDGINAAERIQIKSQNLLLAEAWSDAPITLKVIASFVIYYLLFS